MKATFENSVSVLVRAYMNDTLRHGDCTACAVGNLLGGEPCWNRLFVTPRSISDGLTPQLIAKRGQYVASFLGSLYIRDNPSDNVLAQIKRGKAAIKKSGYTVKELMRIEYAYEAAPGYPVGKTAQEAETDDTWMFNGLMAVVEVLAEIHGVDLSVKEQGIGQFREVQLQKV